MQIARRALLFFAYAIAISVHAQDVRLLYSQAELVAAGARFSPSLLGLWEEDFLTRLTPAERQRAGAVKLLLPLTGASRAPIDFYSLPAQRQVVVPISSVKFLDDISIAIAHYERHGCGMGAVSDYVAALRERPGEFPGSPREALGVPANALDDEFVDDLSQKLLKSMVYFIVAHEYAHVLHGHRGYDSLTAQEAQRQETEADAFALDVMRRIAAPPLAMAHFFLLVSRQELSPADFDSLERYEAHLKSRATHPVSGRRILAVAEAIELNAKSFARLQADPKRWEQRLSGSAMELRAIGSALDDQAMRRLLAHRGRTIDHGALRTGCR